MPKVVALLVGINDYANISKLHGCVGDITAVEAMLSARVAADALSVRTLVDGAATRAAIIDGFRTHLTTAGDGDTALFFFCGHGSQERCPPEWLALEPSGMNQTIVPVDARANDVFDIADKELSALIHEVAASGAQVVTFFDSCHSGGVTRDVGTDPADASGVPRMTAASTGRPRTLADYLEAARELYAPEKLATSGPPEPRHIAMMACQHDQLAKEFPLRPPPRRGAFTSALEEAVAALGSSATYLDLMTAIRSRVRDRATDQMPSMAAVGGAEATALFLSGQLGQKLLTVDADASGGWWLSAGTISGVPPHDGGSITTVAIHPRGALDGGAKPEPIATATVELTQADRARLRIDVGARALAPAMQYIGVITALGAVPLHVLVAGEPAEQVSAIATGLASAPATFTVVQTKSATVPTVTVQVADGAVTILGPDGAPLPNLRFATDTAGVSELWGACEHLALWHGLRDRTPLVSTLNDRVVIEVVPVAPGETVVPADRAPLAPENGVITLRYVNGTPPRVLLRVRNTATVPLFVAMLNLTDSFGSKLKFSNKLEPGQVGISDGGKINGMAIAKWRDPSTPSTTDLFKVFVATDDFTTKHLELPSLLSPTGAGVREAVEEEEPDSSFWGTTTVRVDTLR